MRKFILLFLVINFNFIAYNQIITGNIKDIKTDSIICFASVYINGTFVGTQSNINGNFKLDISKNTSMPLTISSIGYYSVILTDFATDKPLLVYMKPRIYEMNEVVISSKSMVKKRKKVLKLFKLQFLGTSANAQKCIIINEKDITFNYESDHDTLKAFASKPIVIDNEALGYKITYYLDKFEYDKRKQNCFTNGNIIFKEDSTTDETKRQFYEEHRKNAYMGSKMHFFRELWFNNLDSTGFFIKNSSNNYLHYNDIVFQEQSIPIVRTNGDYKKFLSYNDTLHVYYKGLTNIIFLKTKIYFDKTGYFDQLGIRWQGEMGELRIGDQLPYEYKIN
jgi:hypothetical protein